jgi:Ca2+-binding EF-hand superfamily protein
VFDNDNTGEIKIDKVFEFISALDEKEDPSTGPIKNTITSTTTAPSSKSPKKTNSQP